MKRSGKLSSYFIKRKKLLKHIWIKNHVSLFSFQIIHQATKHFVNLDSSIATMENNLQNIEKTTNRMEKQYVCYPQNLHIVLVKYCMADKRLAVLFVSTCNKIEVITFKYVNNLDLKGTHPLITTLSLKNVNLPTEQDQGWHQKSSDRQTGASYWVSKMAKKCRSHWSSWQMSSDKDPKFSLRGARCF